MHKGYEYSRTGNPTRTALETCLASLEEGDHGLAFASGLAATTAACSRCCGPGDHVVAAEDLYGGTYRLFEKVSRDRCSIAFTYVDGRDPARFERAIRPETKLVWIETPTNPLLHLDGHRRRGAQDLRARTDACWSWTTPSPRPTCSGR